MTINAYLQNKMLFIKHKSRETANSCTPEPTRGNQDDKADSGDKAQLRA